MTTITVFISGLGFAQSPPIMHDNQYKCLNFATLIKSNGPDVDLQLLLDFGLSVIPRDSTIIAWSLGGLFAILLCAHFPDYCQKLILLGTTPSFLASDDWPGISIENATALQAMLANSPSQFNARFLSLVQFPNRSLHVKNLLKQHYQTPSFSELAFLLQTDLRHEFSTLQVPTDFYLADNDAIIPSAALMPAIKKLNPHINSTLIKDSSHACLLWKTPHDQHDI